MIGKLKKYSKRIMSTILWRSKILEIFEKMYGPSVRIVTYHRVLPASKAEREVNYKMICPVEIFEQQIATMKQLYQVIPLRMLVENLNNKKGEKRQVVITFDDGYRDNYDYAFPILQKYNIPATVFLTTNPVENDSYLWWDDLNFWLMRIGENWEFPSHYPDHVHKALQKVKAISGGSRLRAISDVCTELNKLSMVQIRQIVADLRKSNLAKHKRATRPSLMLNWEMVREMKKSGLIDFGVHTVNHLFLDELNENQLRREVYDAKTKIESEVSDEIFALSYPAGRYNRKVKKVVSQLGIKMGLCSAMGANRANAAPLELKTKDAGFLSLDGKFDAAFFACELSGVYDTLRSCFKIIKPKKYKILAP